ncbi:MAG: hypothetical protein II937_13750 [Bacteroidales bacterium]|nr:hypothetical protein [Bacteroidales bacterium]
MTGNRIYHKYNARYDWIDALDMRGDNRKEKRSRKALARHAKRKERNVANKAIKNAINEI